MLFQRFGKKYKGTCRNVHFMIWQRYFEMSKMKNSISTYRYFHECGMFAKRYKVEKLQFFQNTIKLFFRQN